MFNQSKKDNVSTVMSGIFKEIKVVGIWLAVLVIFAFAIFLVNQVYQVYQLASGVSETFGLISLLLMVMVLTGLLAVPLLLYWRLPPALVPPGDDSMVAAHRKKVLTRLKANKVLREAAQVPASDADLEKSLDHLNREADEIIKRTALSVFLTTAVSQNGRLDAFTVLVTHTRMVWKICHLYHQRPGIRDLTRLYANIGATTFLVSEIEDLDISLQLESLLSGVARSSSFNSIPVVGPAANLVMDSIFEGSTNAFLTLRVGIIARRYCSSLTTWDARATRKSATLEAGKMLGQIVASGTSRVVAGVVKAARSAGYERIRSGGEAVVKAGEKIKEGISATARKVNPFRKKTGEKRENE